MTDKAIYFDYAASTPTDPAVVTAMLPYFSDNFGNPASSHQFGINARQAVEYAVKDIANAIGGQTSEIYFTSSGTESNNLAILGTARANKKRGKHIVTTNIEHPSVYNACQALEKDGWQITYLEVDAQGQIDLKALENALTEETVLCTIHYGNSEIGTLLDIASISDICHRRDVPLHVDACQAMAYLPMNVSELGIDLLTFNGSKMYGPKGVAVLFVKDGIDITPIMYGGGQQKSLRSGTLNVPGIIGITKALELSRASDSSRIGDLRDELQKTIQKKLADRVAVNVSEGKRLPNHLSLTFLNQKNKDLVGYFNQRAVAVSAGSACSSSSLSDSHVLRAIGVNPENIHSTIRITLGRYTTQQECSQLLEIIETVA